MWQLQSFSSPPADEENAIGLQNQWDCNQDNDKRLINNRIGLKSKEQYDGCDQPDNRPRLKLSDKLPYCIMGLLS